MRIGDVLTAFINFIYPSSCLHCHISVGHGEGYFCKSCIAQFDLINPEERCPYCFSSDYDPQQRVCYPCFIEKPVFNRCAAAFDYQGPSASLILKMKYANQPYLAKGAGAYMALQFLKINWPLPDLIVPVPLTLVHQISRGYNQSLLLAESLGHILKCPVQQVLRRQWLDHSQAGMSKQQRLELEPDVFSIKKGVDIRDKIILLVDDVMTSGRTLNCCAEILHAGYPKDVYALSFCRAM